MNDLSGKVFGKLTVIGFSHNIRYAKSTASHWHCICECGEKATVARANLVSGRQSSCGCLHQTSPLMGQATLTHGHSRGGTPTAEYKTWQGIIQRCHNPSSSAFHRYGARGITVCDRWRNDFGVFLLDMGNRPSLKHSIDRKNNDLGYSPENCRWATVLQQRHNRRDYVARHGSELACQ